MNTSDVSVQSAVADEVNRRLEKATRELEAKYSQGRSLSPFHHPKCLHYWVGLIQKVVIYRCSI